MTPRFPADLIVSERELAWRAYMDRIRGGDSQSLGALYDETGSALYSLAHRITGNSADAEEVTLDVFQQVWTQAGDFDPSRGSVWCWLTLMTRCRAIDKLRASAGGRSREQPYIDQLLNVPSADWLPEEATIFSQNRHILRQALITLPTEQREALELAYYSELSHTEVAARLGVPLGTIKTRIRAGMQKLRSALAQSMGRAPDVTQ